MTSDRIGTHALNNTISQWMSFRRYGVLPRAGGWLDQPLSFISTVTMLDFLADTKRQLTKDNDWNKLSMDEITFLQWLMKEDEDDGA